MGKFWIPGRASLAAVRARLAGGLGLRRRLPSRAVGPQLRNSKELLTESEYMNVTAYICVYVCVDTQT